MELFLKSGELGSPNAYNWLGNIYRDGVERNLKKARYYYELGAIRGSIYAIYNLALLEKQAGSFQRASKHFLICAKAGYKISLKQVKYSFEEGYITKDEYRSTEGASEAEQGYKKVRPIPCCTRGVFRKILRMIMERWTVCQTQSCHQ